MHTPKEEWWCNSMKLSPLARRRPGESGQTTALTLIILAVFLLGFLGFATDYAQIWAHRQMAQSAADAACQAGAADLFLNYSNSAGASSDYGLNFGWIGKDFNCSPSSADPACKYAAINGYSGSNVSVTFPTSVPGVPSLSGWGSITNPYIKVTVSDDSPLTFSRFFQSASSLRVKASAICGMSPVAVPIPLVVLHKSASGSLYLNGNPTVTIIGGPPRAIQIDSSSASAFGASGSKALLDVSQAGPTSTGADIGVFGNEPQSTVAGNLKLGAGKWITPAFPYGDPWALISAPLAPGTAGSVTIVGYRHNGCPDPGGCTEFSPGNYVGCTPNGSLPSGGKGCLIIPAKYNIAPNYNSWMKTTPYAVGKTIQPPAGVNPGRFIYQAIQSGTQTSGGTQPVWPQTTDQTVMDGLVNWQNVGNPTSPYNTAIFDPGLYYLGIEGVQLNSNSTVRPSTATGDGSYGTTFYFSAGGAEISVDANSGKSGSGLDVYTVAGNAFSQPLQCPSGLANPPQVPATVDGNILLGPCTGAYGGASSDGHQYRGFLFFGSRAFPGTPSWGGGGQFLLSGFMYFHHTGYSSVLSMSGGSGSGAYTLGNIVADKVTLGGNSQIKMILNPASSYQILRPTLLQ
jgi:hypothetical protein